MDKSINCSGFFDSFGRTFDWLENTLRKHFNEVHKTNHKVQSKSALAAYMQSSLQYA